VKTVSENRHDLRRRKKTTQLRENQKT